MTLRQAKSSTHSKLVPHCKNHLTLKITSGQVVETSVNVVLNNPSQDYTHPDDRDLIFLNYEFIFHRLYSPGVFADGPGSLNSSTSFT